MQFTSFLYQLKKKGLSYNIIIHRYLQVFCFWIKWYIWGEGGRKLWSFLILHIHFFVDLDDFVSLVQNVVLYKSNYQILYIYPQ